MNRIVNALKKTAGLSDVCDTLTNANDALDQFKIIANNIVKSTSKRPIYFNVNSLAVEHQTGAESWIYDTIGDNMFLDLRCIIKCQEDNRFNLGISVDLDINSPALHNETSHETYTNCTLDEVKAQIEKINDDYVNNILNRRPYTDCVCEYLRDHADYIDTRNLVKSMENDFSYYGKLETEL